MKVLYRTINTLLLLLYINFIFAQIEDKQYAPAFLSTKSLDIPFYILPEVNNSELLSLDTQNQSRNKVLQYAVILDVDINITEKESCEILENGDKIWRLRIVSADAYSLGVFFKKYQLAKGARLFIYSADKKHIRGAFTSKNNKENGALAIAPIKGDEIIVEYYEPKEVLFNGELEIGSIAHDYKNVFAYINNSQKGFGDSGDCNSNINCEDFYDWEVIKQSVCMVTYNGRLCTGALINNTKNDGRPYFLTAYHCIADSIDATAAIFHFNYESPGCENELPLLGQTISGSKLIATPDDKSLDYSLLEMSVAPPSIYNPYYAGWNRDIIEPDTVTVIHHPRGDIKKISVDKNRITTGNYEEGYIEFTHWWIKEWDVGTTEIGSSGAPLFNREGLIIGDLSGGEASCDNNYNDYFAQLHRSWNDLSGFQLSIWLDPDNLGVLKQEGYKPYDTIPTNLRYVSKDTVIYLKWNEIIDTSSVYKYLVYKNNQIVDSCSSNIYVDTLRNDSLQCYEVSALLMTPDGYETKKSNKCYVRLMQSLTVPYMEGFNGQNKTPNFWFQENSNDTIKWSFQSGRQDGMLDTAFEGSYNAFFKANNNEITRLVLPKMDLSSNSNALLSFYIHNQEFDSKHHVLNILYKEADSLRWKPIRTINNEFNTWEKVNIPLINLSQNYQIALEAIGSGGYGICIDSLAIQEDGKHVHPEIYLNQDTICVSDTIEFSTNLDASYSFEWDFGEGAIPEKAFGKGPHKVKYMKYGIKHVRLIVNDTYVNQYSDIIVYDLPKPVFTRSGNVLISASDFGNQWYLNGEIIPGAIDKEYVMQEDGEYFVVVTSINNCISISESFYLILSDIFIPDKELQFNGIKIYPNPSTGQFEIRINRSSNDKDFWLNIIDMTGRKVYTDIIKSSQETKRIMLDNIREGMHIVTLFDGVNSYSSKIIIKK